MDRMREGIHLANVNLAFKCRKVVMPFVTKP